MSNNDAKGGVKRSRVDTNTNTNDGNPSTNGAASPAATNRVDAVGHFGSWLSKVVVTAQQQFFGTLPAAGTQTPMVQTLQRIANFLAQHQLAEAAGTANGDGANPSISASTSSRPKEQHIISTTSYYLPTLKEFAQAQLDRQAAGLRTNADRETATGVTQLIEDHSSALQMVLLLLDDNNDNADDATTAILLSDASICNVHRRLCARTHPLVAGHYRTSRVRAGQTPFCAPKTIGKEMDLFWTAMRKLEEEYAHSSSTNGHAQPVNVHVSKLYNAIALAATAMFGINDIHPFGDGNGRTSRIYANGLLKQLVKLPFTITIAATPQQRQEYITAIRRGRQQLDDYPNTTDLIGVMQPLMQILIERMAHAVAQIQSSLSDRARAAVDEEEARIARRVRERAAQGQCIICLDGSPNIATLCCGQAVHLNCIAEWLANSTTCVNCRNPLPQLNVPGRQQRQEDDGAQQDDTFNNLQDAFHAMHNAVQRVIELDNDIHAAQDEQEFTTTHVDDDGPAPNMFDMTSTVEMLDAVQRAVDLECRNCRNPSALDCANHMCARCCDTEGDWSCDRHGTSGNLGDYSTTGRIFTDNEAPPTCASCSNIAASDCRNRMCGGCCTTNGYFACERHPQRSPSPLHQSDSSTTFISHNNYMTSTTIWAQDEEDDEEDTSFMRNHVESPQGRSQSYCIDCARNRAALDCANLRCGRCCMLSGLAHHCTRHGG